MGIERSYQPGWGFRSDFVLQTSILVAFELTSKSDCEYPEIKEIRSGQPIQSGFLAYNPVLRLLP
jgi:hypothetical protein